MSETLNKLLNGAAPEHHELADFIEHIDGTERALLHEAAAKLRDSIFGRRVYFRGLIEFTNYCAQNCLYCGIRRDNKNAARYRLTEEQILECCRLGHELGYRSFVLQGGEDGFWNDDRLVSLVASIRTRHQDSAITLSVGERTRSFYQQAYDAGADRFLLRHESANKEHYSKLHPCGQTLENRLRCLNDLKEIGYQTGAGFMVGSPYQTPLDLASDLLFLHSFKPHMIGIGPFMPHHDTPFAAFAGGSLETTLDMLAITRLLIPDALLPATTALGSICEAGRELGLKSGANVVMPNLSPSDVRSLYSIYDNKKSIGSEAAECLDVTKKALEEAGFEADMSRGDWGQKDAGRVE